MLILLLVTMSQSCGSRPNQKALETNAKLQAAQYELQLLEEELDETNKLIQDAESRRGQRAKGGETYLGASTEMWHKKERLLDKIRGVKVRMRELDVLSGNTSPDVWQKSQIKRMDKSKKSEVNLIDGQAYVWISLQPPRGYWIGKSEVTVDAWRKYASRGGHPMPQEPHFNVGWKDGTLPIVNIDWNQASEFCRWAGGRLPSESEWEHAEQAGPDGPMSIPPLEGVDSVAWCLDNSGRSKILNGGAATSRIETLKRAKANGSQPHPVMLKRPNAWGLHDMLGNVNEWVADRWLSSEALESMARYGDRIGRQFPVASKLGGVIAPNRIVRGGGWLDDCQEIWGTRRNLSYARVAKLDTKATDLGFRCVLEEQ